MREGIGLYKAKRVDNGKWVEGNLVLSNDAQDDFKAIIIPQTNNGIFTKHTGFKNISCYLGFDEWYKVDESTLCQWTGLVDKNEVKVFEGDIVTLRTQADLEYGFHKRRCDIKFDEYHRFVAVGMTTHPLIDKEEWEVIGNIHDKAVEE